MDPIKELYDNLKSGGFISDKVQFDAFSKKVSTPEGQKALYGALKSQPVEGSEFGAAGASEADFMAKFFSKKKDGTAGLGSGSQDFLSKPPAPVLPAEQVSSADPFFPKFGEQPAPKQSSAPEDPNAIPQNLLPSTPQDNFQPARVVGSGQIVESNLTGDEDPLSYAPVQKESRAKDISPLLETPGTAGEADQNDTVKNALAYTEDARRQMDIATQVLKQTYGDDWRTNGDAKKDPYFQKLENGLRAYGKGFDAYNSATGAYDLSGDEDPAAFGEARRSRLPGYEYKKKYDDQTPLRKEKRQLDNIAEYGAAAKAQERFSDTALKAKYGDDWQAVLEHPDVDARTQSVAEDPEYQRWVDAIKAQNAGAAAFKQKIESSVEYKKMIAEAAKAGNAADISHKLYPGPEALGFLQQTAITPGSSQLTNNWVLRKGAQLLGSAMSLPRTVGQALPGASTDKWTVADQLGSWADEIVRQSDVKYPKPSELQRPLYQRVAEFEGRKVYLSPSGKIDRVSGGDDLPEGFEQRFKSSGAADMAVTEYNGTTAAIDKALDSAADLLLYRVVGGGQKIGTALTSFVSTHQRAYQEALEQQRLSGDDAAQFAFISAAIQGVLEAYVGDIETNVGKKAMADALNIGRKEALAVAGKVSAAERAKIFLMPVIKEVAGENKEEILQAIGDGVIRAAYNGATGSNFEGAGLDKESLKETVLVTSLLTAPLAAVGMGGSVDTYRRSALLGAAKNPESFNRSVDELLNSGAIDQKKATDLKDKIAKMAAFNKSLPAQMQDEERSHALALSEYALAKSEESKDPNVMPAQQKLAAQEAKESTSVAANLVSEAEKQIDVIQPKEEPVSATVNESTIETPTAHESAVVEPAEPPSVPAAEADSYAPEIQIESPADAVNVFLADGGRIAVEDQVPGADPALFEDGGERLDDLAASVSAQQNITLEEARQEIVQELKSEPETTPAKKVRRRKLKQEGFTQPEIQTFEEVHPAIEEKVASLSEEDRSAAESFMNDMGIDTVIAVVDGVAEEMDRDKFEELRRTNPAVHQLFFDELSDDARGSESPQDEQIPEAGQAPSGNRGQKGSRVKIEPPKFTSAPETPVESNRVALGPDEVTETGADMAVQMGAISPQERRSGGDEVAEKIIAAGKSVQEDAEAQDEVDDALDAATEAELQRRISAISPNVIVTRGDQIIVARYDGIEDELKALGGRFLPGKGWAFPATMRDNVARVVAQSRMPSKAETGDKSRQGAGSALVANAYDQKSSKQSSKRKKAIAQAPTLAGRVEEAKRALKIEDDARKSRVSAAIERLKTAFPGITVVTDPAEIKEALKEMGIRESVAGFARDGKVYIDLDMAGVDTPLHEFGHIWAELARAKNPKLYQAGIESMKGSEYEEAVNKDERYYALTPEEKLEEALAQAIGERGARIGEETVWNAFRTFLSGLKKTVRSIFGMDPMKMTASEFADYVAAQMMSGEEIAPIEESDKSMRTQSLKIAQGMERSGIPDNDIASITGWRRNAAGYWENEGPSMDVFTDPTLLEPGEERALRDVVSPEIFAYDPALGDIRVRFSPESPSEVKAIDISLDEVRSRGALAEKLRSAILEEISGDFKQDADMSDVAAKERIEMGLPAPEVPGFEAGPGNGVAKFQYASNAVRHSGILAAAKQLVEIEVQSPSGADRDVAVPYIANQMGLDEALVGKMWDDAAEVHAAKNKWLNLRNGKIPDTVARLKKALVRRYDRWLSPNRGLPDHIFKAAQQMEREISALMYRAGKVSDDLQAALKGKSEEIRALTNEALKGYADFDQLPPDVAIHAIAMRNMVDQLSRRLLLSGAVRPGTILTVMENMGVPVTEDTTGMVEEIEAILSKPPFERSPEEQDAVEAFLAEHQAAFGSYLNRSYRAHVYPDWSKRVSQDVIDRAKRYFIREFQQQYHDLAERLGTSDATFERQQQDRQRRLDAATAVAEKLAQDVLAGVPAPNESAQDFADRLVAAKSAADEIAAIAGVDKAALKAAMGNPDAGPLAQAMYQVRRIKMAMLNAEEKQEKSRVSTAKKLEELSTRMSDVQEEINRILYNQEQAGGQGLSGIMAGAKNLSVLFKRKDLAPEIRELLGEYHDPNVNFMTTALKMSNLIASQEFLNTMVSQYGGIYFHNTLDKPSGNFAKVSAAGNPHLTPLDGWWTTPEIIDALRDMRDPAVMSALERLFVTQLVQRVKLGKTVLSPITHARNFWGNTAFMAVNGWNPVKMFQAYRELSPKFDGSVEAWRAYGEKLHRLGVLGESVNAGDLEALRQYAAWRPGADEMADHSRFVHKYLMHLPRKVFEVSKKAYEMEDNFYRVMAFEAEKARYAKALFGASFSDLDADQKSQIEAKAASIVSHVLPTYSYVPKLVNAIRRIPLVGTFVAFPSEMIRVAYNNVQLGIEEMKDLRTAAIGVRRLAGSAAIYGLEAGLIKAAMAAFGYDDEEWKDAEKFVAPFEQTGGLMPMPKDNKGLMGYINISYTNPYGFVPKIVRAYNLDPEKPFVGKVASSIGELAQPFMSPELTFNTFNQLFMNQDDWGRKIRSDVFQDPVFGTNWLAGENVLRQTNFIAKKLQPGILKSARDFWDAYQKNASPSGKVKTFENLALAHVFGLSVQRIDPTVSYRNQMYQLNQEKEEAKRVFSAVQKRLNITYEAIKGEATPDEIRRKDAEAAELLKQNYETAREAYARVLNEAYALTMALQRLGKSPAECQKELNGWSNREKQAILSGRTDIPLIFAKKGRY